MKLFISVFNFLLKQLFYLIFKFNLFPFFSVADDIYQQGWMLYLNEDFEENFIENNWRTELPWGTTDYKTKQCYTRENIEVKDKILNIIIKKKEKRARYYNYGIMHRPIMNYTSGLIMSKNFLNQKYGLFKIKCKLLNIDGIFSSFYLSDNNDVPKIDIFKWIGGKNKKLIIGNYWENNLLKHKKSVGYIKNIDFSKNYFIFSLEWNNKWLKWSINGIPIRVENKGVSNKNLYLVVNAYLKGVIDDSKLPASIKIEWIRTYSKMNVNKIIDYSTII